MEINEDSVEQEALKWFESLDYESISGYEIAPNAAKAEREDYKQIILLKRLQNALTGINPNLPKSVINDAIDRLLKMPHASIINNNQIFYQWLIEGVPVEYRKQGRMVGDFVKLIDFEKIDHNKFLAVNQFAVRGSKGGRRPDIVVFINGLPLVVIELKNPADEKTDIWKAYDKLQNYKEIIPKLFFYNLSLVISDGLFARIGSLTANQDRFMPWRYILDEEDKPNLEFELETLIRGFFQKELLIDYIRYFVIFESDTDTLIKKIAGYHQFHAVRNAIKQSMIASQPNGNKRCGVFWHTQGSGKSLSMACYAGKLIAQTKMQNPTIVVVTDRNDLDDQLFEAFCQAKLLLKQTPLQVENRNDLRQQLKARPAGGVIFTTIQMFIPEKSELAFPCLSDRDNVFVMADECHRSHYGLEAKLNIETGQYEYGYAKHLRDALPHAAFIGFTGTPIELADKSTRTVFGDYISIYDVQQAEEDGAIVPIFYESRLVELRLNQDALENIESEVDTLTESQEVLEREQIKSKWSGLTSIVGTESRLEKIAHDVIEHFDRRLQIIDGKAMIVCMSREICVLLYNLIVKLRQEWHSEDPSKGVIKVVMTGSSDDKVLLKPHIYSKRVRKQLEKRFKDSEDPFKLVIVRDMWLTGFNAPCLHTLYIDKPMQGHSLMQAITRVNRVFHDKPGGVVVDYIGIAHEIRKAVKNYTENKGRGEPVHDEDEAYTLFMEKLDIIRGILYGIDYSRFNTEPLSILPDVANHILSINDGKKRFLDTVIKLIKTYSLCSTQERAKPFVEEVAFYQAIKAALIKYTTTPRQLLVQTHDHVIKQLISRAISANGVLDIFEEIGVEKPDISILSDEFLQGMATIKQKNLAVELLEKLLHDQIKSALKTNVIQQKRFSERLKSTINKYHSRAVETAQILEELIEMAKAFKSASERGEQLGLNESELAFYDALCNNPSAIREFQDATLKNIAIELTEKLRKSTTVDWQVRDSVRAKLRLLVKRILRKYKYPPDQQQQAIELVLKQAEHISEGFTQL